MSASNPQRFGEAFDFLRTRRASASASVAFATSKVDALIAVGLLQAMVVLQPGGGLGQELIRLLLGENQQTKILGLGEQAAPGRWPAPCSPGSGALASTSS